MEVYQHTRYANIAKVHFVSESMWKQVGIYTNTETSYTQTMERPTNMNTTHEPTNSLPQKKIRFLHALPWNPCNTFFYLDRNSQCTPSHLASLIVTRYSEPPNTNATCLEIRTAFVCQLSLWHYMPIRHRASCFLNFPVSVDIWKNSLYRRSACHKACTSTRQQKCWHTSIFHVGF